MAKGVWSLAEGAAWAFGSTALAMWAVGSLAGIAGARQDLQRFDALRVSAPQPAALARTAMPDISSWGLGRIRGWQAALAEPAPPPLAVLHIPKIGLEVAVLPGTDDFVLNRGLGHIQDTALPGTGGNSGIAGHRDGFLRGLKDVAVGDAVELETLEGRQAYRIERTWIVDPEDVSVLDPTPVQSLTLVTCYPFYFIGSAPQRFIVRAVRADHLSVASVAHGPSTSRN